MSWRPGNAGTGKRIWFLVSDDLSLPPWERYHHASNGRLVRYGSYKTAKRAADRMNEMDILRLLAPTNCGA